MPQPVTGTFSATGNSPTFRPALLPGVNATFNVEIRGTFNATIVLQRSFDETNFVTVAKPDFTDASFTAPVSFSVNETEFGAVYRLSCPTHTGGSATYRMSQ